MLHTPLTQVRATCDSLGLPALPNVFTPNGDGLNYHLQFTGLRPGTWALQLVNRWGREVYRTEAYQDERRPAAALGPYY